MTEQSRNLPSLTDLYDERGVELTDKRNTLNVLLNQLPKKEWLKEHPQVKGYKYIPIERIEYLMTRIFIKWRVEVKVVQLLANSVQVTIRLHYLDPITGEWEWQDGIGASPLQTAAGAGAIEFNKMKNAAVMMAAPAAETFAVKDAAEKIGKLFGKDMNRMDQIAYDGLISAFDAPIELKVLKTTAEKLIHDCPDKDLRDTIINEIIEAKNSGAANSDFYSRIIEKLSNNGNPEN